VAYTGVKRYTTRALMRKPERNRPLEIPGYIYIYIYIYICVYNIKMNLKEIRWRGVQ